MSSNGETTTDSPAHAPAAGKGTLIVIFLSLGGLSFAVLQSLVAPALSVIAGDLKVTTADVSWVLTAYLLSASVLTPVLGRLGDMVGKRRILIVVLVLLLIGTVLAALAPNLAVLIIGRVIQGSAGAILPLSIGIVRDELPHSRVPATIGILSAIFGVGAGVGIVAAGPIVQHLNWHWLFWLPAVVVVVALLGAIFGMKESPVRKPGRIDIIGALILGVALVAILLPIDQGQTWGWGNWKTIWLLVLGGLALIAFVIVELRVKEPLVDIRLFRHRGVWSAHLVALTFGFAMFGVFVIIPTLLELNPAQVGFGFDKTVTEAGFFLLPTVLAMVVFGPFAGFLVRKVGPKVPMILGSLLLIVAFAIPAIKHDSLWEVLVSGILTGAAIGMGLASMSNAIIESVPATQTGEATSVNAIARTIGSAIGTAVVAAIITSNSVLVHTFSVPKDSGFTASFWALAGVAVLALLAALAAPSLRKSRQEAAAYGIDDFEVGS